MSKELGEYGGVSLTQFFGGRERGICVQLTRYEEREQRTMWLSVTPPEAAELSEALKKWAQETGEEKKS